MVLVITVSVVFGATEAASASEKPGACCLPDGTCNDSTTLDDCGTMGGMFQGDASSCSDVMCPQPTGACCFGSGACSNGDTMLECENAGGSYVGDGSTCASGICSGVCCFSSGQCIVTIPDSCIGGSGVFMGIGLTCDDVMCTPTIGGCCFDDAMCTPAVTQSECDAIGGSYLGDGVNCGQGACVGACCQTNGTCNVTDSGLCASIGGAIFGGFGTTCADISCAPAAGACCLMSGPCSPSETQVDCENSGGTYLGDGTTCASAVCLGACCRTTGVCTQSTIASCAAFAGAVFSGPGTSCEDIVCVDQLGACCFPTGNCINNITEPVCTNQGGNFEGVGVSCGDVFCQDLMGACCLPDGECQFIGAAACGNLGGTFQGGGVMCADVDCPLLTGACCFSPTLCEFRTEEQCGEDGGMFLGIGSECDGTNCPDDAMGACCFSDGECFVDIEDDCTAQGGAYQGDDSMCEVLSCLGACCNDVGSCQLIDEDSCADEGGTFLGLDSSCDPNPCPQQSGACCFADSMCFETNEDTCDKSGGEYQLNGSTCDPSPCPILGACCFVDGSCQDAQSEDACENFGGEYQGNLTDCKEADCPIFGACCMLDGSCADLTSADCMIVGGDYQGDGTFCGAITFGPQGVVCPPPIDDTGEPGWNWVDNQIELTGDQSVYWSVLTGQPLGVSPFSVLDPGMPPGRPDPAGGTDRVLRGYIVGYAVNANGEEIRWDHLSATVTTVNYRDMTAWEYAASAFQVADPLVAHGAPTGTTGVLSLDGQEYVSGYDLLLWNFIASNAAPYGAPTLSTLTLHPLDADFRQETDGPVTTKASFEIWNENEFKFSGTDRCITCWDKTLVNFIAPPNSLVLQTLQTNVGKARIDGLQSMLCDVDFDPADGQPLGLDPRDVVSQASPLLGVAKYDIEFAASRATFGGNLVGMGTQSAEFLVDFVSAPPSDPTISTTETSDANDAADRLIEVTRGIDDGGGDEEAPFGPGMGRTETSVKGSLIVISDIELRWDMVGMPVQDVFIQATNDFPDDVRVQFYFVNGDAITP
ncbi:MAG: hypothetical protein AAF432_08575 [Planctomycetota bacterium]